MTESERITALEARIAQLEARLNMLEQSHRTYGPLTQPQQVPPSVIPFPLPPYTITC